MYSFIPVAYADVGELLKKVNKVLINPLIYFVFACALVYFLYGVFEYYLNSNKPEARDTGRNHIIWGLVGMAIMLSVFGIMQVLINTFGVEGVNVNTGEVNLK